MNIYQLQLQQAGHCVIIHFIFTSIGHFVYNNTRALNLTTSAPSRARILNSRRFVCEIAPAMLIFNIHQFVSARCWTQINSRCAPPKMYLHFIVADQLHAN
jgi:hypothetical protein